MSTKKWLSYVPRTFVILCFDPSTLYPINPPSSIPHPNPPYTPPPHPNAPPPPRCCGVGFSILRKRPSCFVFQHAFSCVLYMLLMFGHYLFCYQLLSVLNKFHVFSYNLIYLEILIVYICCYLLGSSHSQGTTRF